MRPLIHPLPPEFGGRGTLWEGAGESAGAGVRFHSDLYGNITTFGESGLLEAWSERALNACAIEAAPEETCVPEQGFLHSYCTHFQHDRLNWVRHRCKKTLHSLGTVFS